MAACGEGDAALGWELGFGSIDRPELRYVYQRKESTSSQGSYMRLILAGSAVVAITSLLAPSLQAQRYLKRSQRATVSQTVNTTDISIRYGRPVARGRQLFGDGGVVYHSPWTPGSDASTTVEFSKDVWIDGLLLEAGSYSIWVTPDTDPWRVIFSSAADVFHLPYPEGTEVLELELPPFELEYLEVLTFSFPLVDVDETVIRFQWGTTALDIPVVVEREKEMRPARDEW